MLSVPEPFVFFDDFGDNSLNFALYVYLANARQSFSIQTDLRFAILKAFRANGIEIPYPQTDVHFRDIDWIKRAVMERMMKSAVEAAAAEASAKQPDRSPPNEEKEANDSDGDGGGNGNGGG
ncbi:MAG: mechanosensitive ion channel [Alphaproteobacteria bacterium]